MSDKIGTLLILVLVATTMGLFVTSKTSLAELVLSPGLTMSQLLALVGTVLLALSFVLGSRAGFLEGWFGGLDKVNKVHQMVGKMALIALVGHPLLLALNALPNWGVASMYFFWSDFFEYNLGVIALYLLTLLVFLTIAIKLPYHWWLKTHDLMGLPLLLGAGHIYLIGSDVSRFLPLRVLVLGMLGIGVCFYIYKVWLYRWLGPKCRYRVKSIKKNGEVLEIWLSPVKDRLPFLPGQFGYVSFDQNGLKGSHPFTFASTPTSEDIRFAVKIMGDYTLGLKDLKIGTAATLWGPHGRSYQKFFEKKDVVAVAGGIGITPFLSLIEAEEHRLADRSLDLFYAVGNRKEAVFDGELLRRKKANKNLNYFLYLSETSGHLSADVIEKKIGDLRDKIFFLCGPVAMMDSLTTQLRRKGVRAENIVFESFNFKP